MPRVWRYSTVATRHGATTRRTIVKALYRQIVQIEGIDLIASVITMATTPHNQSISRRIENAATPCCLYV